MKRVWSIFGTLAVLAVYGALVYGSYLIHPGLGWIVGALLVLINALRYTPEARAKSEAAVRKSKLLAEQQEIKDLEQQRENNNARYVATSIRHRGTN